MFTTIQRKAISIVLLVHLVLFTAFAPTASAGYWFETYGSLSYKQMLEEMAQQVRDAVTAAAKIASIKAVTSTLEKLLYGNSSSPRNIRNFNDFLIADPRDAAIAYGQDFLTQTLRGMGSGDYTSASGSVGGDFLAQILQDAGQTVLDQWSGKVTSTVDYMNYCNLSGPSGGYGGANYFTGQSGEGGIFADGNFLCFSSIFANPVNTPIGLALAVDMETAAKYQQEQEVAKLMATSTGVLPDIDQNGLVKNPAYIMQYLQEINLRTIVGSISQIDTKAFSTLIQALAIATFSQVVHKGLSEVNEAVDKNIASFQRQYQEKFGELMDQAGPAASYARDAYTAAQQQQQQKEKRSEVWDNPDTPEDESKQDWNIQRNPPTRVDNNTTQRDDWNIQNNPPVRIGD